MSDPFGSGVSFLLPCSGQAGSTVFRESARNGGVGAATNVSVVAASKSGLGAASFAGSGLIVMPTSSAGALGSGDFCLELTCKTDAALANYNGTATLIEINCSYYAEIWRLRAQYASGSAFANRYSFWASASSVSAALLASANTISYGAYEHVAVERIGNAWSMRVNGVTVATAIDSCAITAVNRDVAIRIGEYYKGAIEWIRITRGSARHDADFTPEALPYPLPDAPVSRLYPPSRRVPGCWMPGEAVKRLHVAGRRSRDLYYGGNGRILGTVERVGNVPLVRRIRLFRDRDGVCVGETWSNAAGAYAFTGVDPAERHSVVAYDHEHNYRAVIADNLTPELMP